MKSKPLTEKSKTELAEDKEEVISQDFEAQIPEEEEKLGRWQKIKARIKNLKKKYVFLCLGGILFLVMAIVIINSSLKFGEFKPPTFPSPTPSPYEEEILNPSAYATDSAVLEIENKIKGINQELENTDLKETGLNPPVLDMKVNFEE
ncbi:MAG: hypothetical protein MUP45_04115 [Candidatus Marinimicrobia bacterium]|nr:hypothetical protein [Candidatus Neomarinimicrobiota bacterium]